LKAASVASQPLAHEIPIYTGGMRVGLLGGSFNPPHLAHRAISLFAIKRLKLDRVWWLVTPGNPLKDNGSLRELEERAEAARQMAAAAQEPEAVYDPDDFAPLICIAGHHEAELLHGDS